MYNERIFLTTAAERAVEAAAALDGIGTKAAFVGDAGPWHLLQCQPVPPRASCGRPNPPSTLLSDDLPRA